MDIRVNETTPIQQSTAASNTQNVDDGFKFSLNSALNDADFQNKVNSMLKDINVQGNLIAKHMDIREMKKYRGLIKDFLNEVVNRSHKFSRENFLDRRGRHRVYGIIKLVDEDLDNLAAMLMEEEKKHVDILGKIGEIEGLLLDILT